MNRNKTAIYFWWVYLTRYTHINFLLYLMQTDTFKCYALGPLNTINSLSLHLRYILAAGHSLPSGFPTFLGNLLLAKCLSSPLATDTFVMLQGSIFNYVDVFNTCLLISLEFHFRHRWQNQRAHIFFEKIWSLLIVAHVACWSNYIFCKY